MRVSEVFKKQRNSLSMIALVYLALAYGVRSEISTPSSLLAPRHYNYHPHEVRQYLEETSVSPTKSGPVVFPNSPPSPRLPLIVTSRPLTESIANSDYHQQNNSATAASLLSSVTYKPFLARLQQYQPFVPSVPYGDVDRDQFKPVDSNAYDDYEPPVLPPIYKAFSDHAQQNLLKVSPNRVEATQRPRKEDYYYNDISSDTRDRNDYDQNKNYAFSYIVKDHKTGDDFSHRQRSSGSATNGEYRVRLPDGRTQIVSYTADENGYKADVRYDNELSNKIDDNNNNGIDNHNNNVYNHNDNNHEYKVREEIPIKEDYNEYYDYSSEYNDKYNAPSKFSIYNPTPTKSYFSTVRPSYDEIKDLFTNSPVTSTPKYNIDLIGDLSNDSDKVVVIGAKRYTDVTKSFQNPTTPYFIPDNFSTSKPILSQNYINRINKYLTFH